MCDSNCTLSPLCFRFLPLLHVHRTHNTAPKLSFNTLLIHLAKHDLYTQILIIDQLVLDFGLARFRIMVIRINEGPLYCPLHYISIFLNKFCCFTPPPPPVPISFNSIHADLPTHGWQGSSSSWYLIPIPGGTQHSRSGSPSLNKRLRLHAFPL